MFKIRYKLLIILLGVSLLPQIVINQIIVDKLEVMVDEKYDREAEFATQSILRYVQDLLSSNERNINSMANNVKYIYDDNMKIVKDDMQQLVRILQESSGVTPNCYVGTAEGEMYIYPEDILPAGYDPRLRSWYQMAILEKEKSIWFGPYIDQGTKQLVLTVSKYYKYKDKEGVVGIDIGMTNMREILKAQSLGNMGEIFVIDDLGEILLHSNTSFEGLNIKYTKYLDEGINKALEAESFQGEHYNFRAQKITDHLFVITVINRNEIDNLISSQMESVQKISLIFVLVTLAIIIFFADRLTRPIYGLIDAMKRTEEGQYEVKVSDKGNDEIALMMRQFNQMSSSIIASREEMTALYEELSASEETLQDQYDELIRNRDQIALSERRYKLVFDASNEGLWEINTDNRLVFFSNKWFRNFFADTSSVDLFEWVQRIHPEDRPRFTNGIERHLNKETPYFHEVYRVKDINNVYRLIQSRGKAEFDAIGEMVTFAGSHLDVTEQKNNEEQILKMAYFDQITGLANRRNFERELDRYFSNHLWGRVIYMDIVDFKKTNELYGYLQGDQVLRDLAGRLKQTFDGAFIARISGDEFAVVLGGEVDEEAVEEQLSQFIANCCEIEALEHSLHYHVVTVQCKFPNEGKNTEELFASIMTKMHEKKIQMG